MAEYKNVKKPDKEYLDWLKRLKEKVRLAQIKAATAVNTTLLRFYWDLGADIIDKQKNSNWGEGFIKRLSKDLSSEFPTMKGFSYTNIKYIRQWYLFWNQIETKSQQLVGELEALPVFQLPWGHNIIIISKSNNIEEALFYAQKTIENGWSRNVLTNQIEAKLFERSGKITSNFKNTLPKTQSDLARQTLKDPYNFDFLAIREKYNERDLENALVKNISDFLLELGAGFSYVGKQYKITVDNEDFFIDLLFYNIKLHSFVVIELKTGKFKPEYTGKLNFYISAVDSILKTKTDNPTIGLLICKEKNKTIVEYALKDINKPIGISEYKLTKVLPEDYKLTLPTIEEIEQATTKNLKTGSEE
jgi:predicted nuclease of restriction endonuclease-like (RecB) superfamily